MAAHKHRSILLGVTVVALLAAGFYLIVTRTVHPPSISAPAEPGKCSVCGKPANFVVIDPVEDTRQEFCPPCWVEWQEREGVPVWPETKGRRGNEENP